ncbi:MAG: chemotaxis protein CheX [Spirochaetaceae bacterium]|jgi:chemotaxis protein CheX|nr:chemotaxis protein CheX [Spirochaetaceae bacterium]
MRVEYINPFVEATFSILQEVLGAEVKRGNLYLKSSSMAIQGVAALVGLAGDVEGRVLFDMTKPTALFVAGAMNGGEVFTAMDEMAKATIQELANMITARAVTQLADLGFKFDLTPPALFTGDNMEVSNNLKVEALIVPMDLGPNGANGRIDVNVAIRERH